MKKRQTVELNKAADIFGISVAAMRKRVIRGSIEAIKDKAGKWQVYITDEDLKKYGIDPAAKDDTEREHTRTYTRGGHKVDTDQTIIDHLTSEVIFLREELYRKDTIIMKLSEGIKLLEAPKKKSLIERIFGSRQEDKQA